MARRRVIATWLIGPVCAALLALVLSAAGAQVAGKKPVKQAIRNWLGPAVKIGNGYARTFISAEASGRPTAFGVEFPASMLEALPAKPNEDRALDWHYFLAFPRSAPTTGFDHLMIDWHPMGHMPKGIYTLPHFDFHFYVVDEKEQLSIRYPHDEVPEWTGIIFPKASLMAPGYFIPPAGQVSKMGIHAIWIGAPEMQCRPFTNTFIYGYYRGRLIFVEPMITMSYLKSAPNATMALPLPAEFSYPAYYPTQYRLSFDPGKQMYTITLGHVKPWEATKLAASSHTR
jgi:hypothetical protein